MTTEDDKRWLGEEDTRGFLELIKAQYLSIYGQPGREKVAALLDNVQRGFEIHLQDRLCIEHEGKYYGAAVSPSICVAAIQS